MFHFPNIEGQIFHNQPVNPSQLGSDVVRVGGTKQGSRASLFYVVLWPFTLSGIYPLGGSRAKLPKARLLYAADRIRVIQVRIACREKAVLTTDDVQTKML